MKLAHGLRDALVINSFGGSILAAAMNAGLPIRASLETAGYGHNVQKFNAPGLPLYPKTADWPKDQNLSKTVVMGHPPCSAFSTQNTAMRQKMAKDSSASINSAAFQCTRDLMKYSMDANAGLIMIESVPRAIIEAAPVHEEFAVKYGYSLIRVIQNSSCFGLSQDRKRIWVIFAKGLGRSFNIEVPNVEPRPLADVITGQGDVIAEHARRIKGYDDRMAELGMKSEIRADFWRGEFGFGKMAVVLADYYNEPREKAAAGEEKRNWQKVCDPDTKWTSSMASLLKPDGLAPVVLANSLWVFNGKPLTLQDYCRIMGFPAWYKFPPSVASTPAALGFLSRGVCPPIVSWLIENFAGEVASSNFTVKDGDTLDVIAFGKAQANPATGLNVAPRQKKSRAMTNRAPVDEGFNAEAPRLVVASIADDEAGEYLEHDSVTEVYA